jgi:hypothetical protein
VTEIVPLDPFADTVIPHVPAATGVTVIAFAASKIVATPAHVLATE